MGPRIKALLVALFTWPPLNRVVTNLLRAALPPRVLRQPTFVHHARRVGVVEATLPNGTVIRVWSRGDDGITGSLFWLGWTAHEPETTRPFYELAVSARITLDIGAHVGYFALLSAHANPAGRVYAFEPLDRVRARLEHNLALNQVSNVTCVPVAAGFPGGVAQFFHVSGRAVPSSSSLSRSFMESVVGREELTSSTVEVIELDDFVESHGLTGVDLIKVDTETTEAAVFRGMLRTLRRDRPHIVCEVLDAEVAEAIELLLAPLGYLFFRLTATGPVPCAHITPDPQWRNFMFQARKPS